MLLRVLSSRAFSLAAAGAVGAAVGAAAMTSQRAEANQLLPEPATAILPFGYPDNRPIRQRDGHVVRYNNQWRIPSYVCEHLTRDSIRKPQGENVDRRLCVFGEDPTVHPYFRSSNSDYQRSGYDRGHLAAAGNHSRSQAAMMSTFYLSNIAPQVGKGFNRDAWNKLEMYSRRLTREYDHVYVCSGPLFLPNATSGTKKYVKYEVIGQNNVAVPTHFYKLVAGVRSNGVVELQSFIMPNAPIPAGLPLANFLVPLEEVERKSGYLFYEKLPQKYGKTLVANGRLAGLFDVKDDVT